MNRGLFVRDFGPDKWKEFFVKKEYVNGWGKYRVYFNEKHIGDYDDLTSAEQAFLVFKYGDKRV